MSSLAGHCSRATTVPKSGALAVGEELLRPIKQHCKANAGAAQEAWYYLSADLGKQSGAVRVRALTVMDCLLHRSQQFRAIVCANIKLIAKATGLVSGTEASSASSASASSASSASASSASSGRARTHQEELLTRGKELVEAWDLLYGERHTQLRALARYLRESLGMAMPDILATAQRQEALTRRNRQHACRLLLLRRDQVLGESWAGALRECRTSIARLQECFQILFPRIGGDTGAGSGDMGTGGIDTEGGAAVEDRGAGTGRRLRLSMHPRHGPSVSWAHSSLDLHDDEDEEGGGLEAEGGGEEDVVAPDAKNAIDGHENDDDDVDWEEAAGQEKGARAGSALASVEETGAGADGGDGDNDECPDFMGVPYTLQITLSTASGLQTADNEPLVLVVREQAQHLAAVLAPRLLGWQRLFREVLGAQDEQLREREGRGGSEGGLGQEGPLSKRRRDERSSTSFSTSDADEAGADAGAGPELRLREDRRLTLLHLQQLDRLLLELRGLLTGRCRDFLQD